MSQPDEIVHQPVRMRILSALRALPAGEQVEFVRMRDIVKATDGALGAHIATLDKAGYILVEKDFHARRPRTRISLTPVGRRALEDYVRYLQGILDGRSP